MASPRSIRIGISQCLLGDPVRYDGGHKRNDFLADVLDQHVEWVPVCPEVEAGFGVPREAMQLVGSARHPRLMTIATKQDKTNALVQFSVRRVQELESLDLSGYVFKARSPSCGTQAVPLYDRDGGFTRSAVGLFARAFMEQFPLMPIEEEDRLLDENHRAHFLERVYGYRRWREFLRSPVTKQRLVQFHATHKYLLMAHSLVHAQRLGSLVARAHRSRPADLARRYGVELMDTMRIRTSLPKHANVLQHLLGYFKKRLTRNERATILRVIDDFRTGHVPLAVPLTAIEDLTQRFELSYLCEQVYFEPYPRQLMTQP